MPVQSPRLSRADAPSASHPRACLPSPVPYDKESPPLGTGPASSQDQEHRSKRSQPRISAYGFPGELEQPFMLARG